MPRWKNASRASRSPTPASVRRSTVPCSSTPARIVDSISARERLSTTIESMPRKWRRCERSSPAGPAPTMPTLVCTFRSMLPPVQDPISFVDVRAHRLEVADIAARKPGRPALLFLHEGLGSLSMWRDFPECVAARSGCRTVVYSRAGFGRSSPRVDPYTSTFMHEEALEILPALRERLAIENPVLIGHSTGASMALIHAASERVPGVVAMAPFAFVEQSNLESIRAARERYAHIRDRLARHHDDVDGVFHGWNDLWLDPA